MPAPLAMAAVPAHELGRSPPSLDRLAGARCAAEVTSSQAASSNAKSGWARLAELHASSAIAAGPYIGTVAVDGTTQRDSRGSAASVASSRLPRRASGIRPGASGAVRGACRRRSGVGPCRSSAALVDRRASRSRAEALGRLARSDGERVQADLEPYGSWRAVDRRDLDGGRRLSGLHRPDRHGSRAFGASQSHLSVPSPPPTELERRLRQRCGHPSEGRGDERPPSPGDLTGDDGP